MPDVGVLQLTIKDNSESAATGLERLDDALIRIKHAVSGGLKLGTVATSLKKLTDVINNELSGSTLVKLGQLADELSKLKGMGDLNIRIGGGTSIESIRSAVRETMQDMSGINTGFDDIKSRTFEAKGGIDGMNASLRDTQALMQNKAWSGGIDQFREMFEQYARIRAAMSLPAGDQTGISTQVENGWTAWKEGAIEVEGTVSDAMDTVTARLGEPIQYLTGMSSQLGNLNDYLGQTNGLMDEMARNTSSMSSGEFAIVPYSGGNVKEEVRETVEEIREATSETQTFRATLEESKASAKTYYASLEDAFNGIRHGVKIENDLMSKWLHGQGTANEQLYALQSAAKMFNMTIDEVKAKIAELLDKEKQIGSTDMSSGASAMERIKSAANGLLSKLRNLGQSFRNLRNELSETGGVFGHLKNGIEKMFPTLTTLLKRFKSIATMRALRYVIRQISAGFSEGIQNVYQYSKAIGSSFAPSMDSAASSIATMKNALGAALAPAIQAMIPFLNTLINGFINLLNYVNQFFALLNGQKTWTRAITQTASAFDKQKKAAKGASSAMKDLLADWDELNIIQSQNGGGSGTVADSSAEDYANMFEEVSEFSEAVKDVVGWIQDHLGLIKNVAKAIGIAILGWKLSRAFSAALNTLGSLVLGATGIVVGLQLAWEGAHNAGLNGGFDSTTLLTTAAGVLSTTIGGALIGFKVGGIWGAVIGGATGLIASISVAYSAYIDGERTRKLLANWNAKDEFSPDEIAKYIESSFTFPIAATIEKIDLITSNAAISVANLNNSITTFTSKYRLAKVKVGLRADDSEDALAELNTSANDVIKAFNERVDSVTETVKASIELLPLVGKDGEEYTEGMIDNLMVGNKELKEYMTSLGTDIAKAYNEAVIKHWGEGTEEAYLKQIERLNSIMQKKEEYVTKAKIEQKKNVALENMNYESAEKANEEIEKWKEEYINSAKSAIEARRDGQLDIAGYWTGVLDDFSKQYEKGELDISFEEYTAKKKEYEGYIEAARNAANADSYWLDNMDEYLNQQIEELEDYHESMEQFKKKWIEVLKENEGYDITSFAKGEGKNQMEMLSQLYKLNPSKREGFVSNLISTFNSPDWIQGVGTELAQNVIKSNGIDWVEIMSDSDKSNLMGYLTSMFDAQFARDFVSQLDISDELKDSFYKFLPKVFPYGDQFGNGAYDAIKEAIKDGLQQNEISNIKDRFGIDDYTFNLILKELGYRTGTEGRSDVYAIDPTKIKPLGLIASAGVSDVGWAPYHEPAQSFVGESGGMPLDMEAEVDGGLDEQGVATGVQNGTKDINEALGSILRGVNALLNKQWVVNVTPNSSWGGFNSRSNREYEKVTG